MQKFCKCPPDSLSGAGVRSVFFPILLLPPGAGFRLFEDMKPLLALLLVLGLCPGSSAQWAPGPGMRLESAEGIEGLRRAVSREGRSAEVHLAVFSPKTFTLAVMDNPGGGWSLAAAAQKRGALAAVNGGYFHPDRTPLGLVVRQGRELHAMEKARLLSGLVYATPSQIGLVRVHEFKRSASLTAALQAGPFLVDGGRVVPGLNADRVAARTVVFTEDSGRFGLLVCHAATLAETAQILATPGLSGRGRRITRALNLDGGSSTGFWLRGTGGAAATSLPEGKEVRNYLAVVPRTEAAR